MLSAKPSRMIVTSSAKDESDVEFPELKIVFGFSGENASFHNSGSSARRKMRPEGELPCATQGRMSKNVVVQTRLVCKLF